MLESGKVAKTCQQCFDANERFRVQRAELEASDQVVRTTLENERRWARGKLPIEPDEIENPTPPSQPTPDPASPIESTPEVRRRRTSLEPIERVDYQSDVWPDDDDVSRAKF